MSYFENRGWDEHDDRACTQHATSGKGAKAEAGDGRLNAVAVAQVSQAGYGASRVGHVCNCVGCCDLCGQCSTAPWHAGSCHEIAGLRAEERLVIARELARVSATADAVAAVSEKDPA